MKIDLLSGLNPAQKQAVLHQGSPLLLLAGAGSGKTKVLTHRAAHLIKSGAASASQILLLTFTNKAAGEMKERMSKLVAGLPANTAELWAGTFHSFASKILRRDGRSIGLNPDFVIYDTDDQETLLKNLINDSGLTTQEFKPSSVLYFIEDCKNKFLTPDQAENFINGYWDRTAIRLYRAYQKKLLEYQAVDFNDLLFKTVELLSSHPEVLDKYRDIYRYILVDEYQDTNQIQYLLTRLLAEKFQQITAVGDASQAIYGWRGANYQNLVNFTRDFPSAKVINLEQNYRSTEVILNAANAVICKNTSHPVLKLFTTKKTDDLIKIFEAESELAEAEYISERITFLHNLVKIPYNQIAVLYRMNAQSRVLEESFLKNTIPYVLLGGLRFYERAEIKDVLSLLRIIVNPGDHLSQERVEKTLGKRRKTTFDQIVTEINIGKNSSPEILEQVLARSGYLQKYDPRDEDDQKRLENINELKSVAARFPHLTEFLENIALVEQEYSLQEKNKKKENRDGVRLMTLHGSKGLEFEAVFLVGFEEGILPHSRSMIEDADIEEERRLSYVGITRAKDFLYISYATRRLFFGKSSLNEPSRFLLDIPEKLLEYDRPKNIIHDLRGNKKTTSDDLIYDKNIY